MRDFAQILLFCCGKSKKSEYCMASKFGLKIKMGKLGSEFLLHNLFFAQIFVPMKNGKYNNIGVWRCLGVVSPKPDGSLVKVKVKNGRKIDEKKKCEKFLQVPAKNCYKDLIIWNQFSYWFFTIYPKIFEIKGIEPTEHRTPENDNF